MQEQHDDIQSSLGAAGAPSIPPPSAAIASAEVEPEAAPEPENAARREAPQEDAKPAEEPAKSEPKQAAAPQSASKPDTSDKLDSRCRPGRYTGVINGTVTLTGLIMLGTMAGTVALELVPYQDRSDVLAVRDGRVEGLDDKQAKFSADLTGIVNCASGEVVSISVEHGSFEGAALPGQVSFAGAAKGQYSMDPPALAGTWQVSDDTALLAGDGTWSATMSEPY